MREIKFILVNKDDEGGWHRSFPLTVADLIDGEHIDTFNEDTIVCEYTGLHDKNGKEIYEGDVVRAYESAPLENFVSEVKWHDSGFWLTYPKGGHCMAGEQHREIIGNIYESKHLLDNTDTKE